MLVPEHSWNQMWFNSQHCVLLWCSPNRVDCDSSKNLLVRGKNGPKQLFNTNNIKTSSVATSVIRCDVPIGHTFFWWCQLFSIFALNILFLTFVKWMNQSLFSRCPQLSCYTPQHSSLILYSSKWSKCHCVKLRKGILLIGFSQLTEWSIIWKCRLIQNFGVNTKW